MNEKIEKLFKKQPLTQLLQPINLMIGLLLALISFKLIQQKQIVDQFEFMVLVILCFIMLYNIKLTAEGVYSIINVMYILSFYVALFSDNMMGFTITTNTYLFCLIVQVIINFFRLYNKKNKS